MAAVRMTFKRLSPEEEAEYRQHAREVDPENMDWWDIYHPVSRDEWIKRGIHPWTYVDGP